MNTANPSKRGMMARKEFRISRWWLLLAVGCGVAAYVYAQSLGWPAWVCFVCATCAGGLFTTGPYVVLVFYATWKAEKNKSGWPYDVP
jgi:fatty acid desaturase